MYMCIILYNTHVHVCVGCTVIIVTCGDTDVHTVHVCSFFAGFRLLWQRSCDRDSTFN